MKREESMYAKKRGAWQELRSALYYMGAAAEQRPTEPSLEGGAAEPRPMGHSLEERPVMEELWGIDERLGIYFEELGSDKWDDGQDCNTRHNYYEICGGLRFLRYLREYEIDVEKVRKVIRLREGGWKKGADGIWRHVSGGIPQPSSKGKAFYRWEPFQVFILTSVFGFYCWVDTGTKAGERELTDTEKVMDGRIYDRRRLCTNYTLYAPRKVDKTGMSAYIQLVFFLMEDYNSEIYCCANSADQSKTLFTRTRGMVDYLNHPHRFHVTATIVDWEAKYREKHNSMIVPLTAGGKTKDGLQAQLCCADEYGSAAWVKDHSDMKSLVDVIESSMGPRREPLTFITTTAGNITDGPFVQILNGLHRVLSEEGDGRRGGAAAYGTQRQEGAAAQQRPTERSDGQRTEGQLTDGRLLRPEDRTMGLLLEPDAWERDEEALLSSKSVRRKINPMLGKIVQESFYDEGAAKVRREPSYITEYVPKYMNVYRSGSVKEWISPELVRSLQMEYRVEDCTRDKGWIIFTGMDFSLGDDLHAVSYLCFNVRDRTFFADMDSWMSSKALEASPLRDVYRSWVAAGWLHVSPGATLDPLLPVGRIAALNGTGRYDFITFHYDPFKSKQPINALCEYFYNDAAQKGLRVDPNQYVLPCRQNYATFNPLVNELDFMVKNDPAMIRFSMNPMWPWQAGNMVLDTSTDGMENHKPVKRGGKGTGSRENKIDNWICLLEGLAGFDRFQGKEHEG